MDKFQVIHGIDNLNGTSKYDILNNVLYINICYEMNIFFQWLVV